MLREPCVTRLPGDYPAKGMEKRAARTSSYKAHSRAPALPEATQEQTWKKFHFPVTFKEFAPVTCVDFCPAAPYDLAVSNATRVQIYSSVINQVKRTITRFKETVYSAKFRQDGQLLVAGGEEGLVKVFDMNSRSVLRQCEGHTKAIRQTCFTPDKLRLLSTGDDKTLRTWDLSTGESIREFSGHEDYVRALSVSSGSSDVCATGSYDHTVKLWDARAPSAKDAVVTMNHGAPVEAVLLFPSASVCVSAGDNRICVWDLFSGGRQLFSFSNHQKTVTCLCLDASAKCLLSGGVDRQLKVYDVMDYSVVHGISYSAPILSIGLSANDKHLAVGMSDGTLSIKRRGTKASSSTSAGDMESEERGLPSAPSAPARIGTRRYFARGTGKAEKGDLVVHQPRPMYHLKAYESQLKQFRYTEALNAALKTNDCDVVAGMFQDLIHRDGLSTALAGRNHKSLLPIMKFLVHYVGHPVYQTTILDVANVVLDMYSSKCGQSRQVDQQFTALRSRVQAEVNMQRRMLSVLGMLDVLFAMATTRQ